MKGDKIFLLVDEMDQVVFAGMSVTAVQDVYNVFTKAGKHVNIVNRDTNVYVDPVSGETTRYVDPDTARKQAKKVRSGGTK